MEIKDKIEKSEQLYGEVEKLKNFIILIEQAQIIDEKNAKSNELKGINRFSSLIISAFISTGSQSPRYEKAITDNETIKSFVNAGLSQLKETMANKEKELESLFN